MQQGSRRPRPCARQQGKKLGRPKMSPKTEGAIAEPCSVYGRSVDECRKRITRRRSDH